MSIWKSPAPYIVTAYPDTPPIEEHDKVVFSDRSGYMTYIGYVSKRDGMNLKIDHIKLGIIDAQLQYDSGLMRD